MSTGVKHSSQKYSVACMVYWWASSSHCTTAFLTHSHFYKWTSHLKKKFSVVPICTKCMHNAYATHCAVTQLKS